MRGFRGALVCVVALLGLGRSLSGVLYRYIGDYLLLDWWRRFIYRWPRQAGVLLVCALVVCAISFGVVNIAEAKVAVLEWRLPWNESERIAHRQNLKTEPSDMLWRLGENIKI